MVVDARGEVIDDAAVAREPRLAAAALFYARRGFAVFPLRPRTKQPLTEHGVKDASRDENVVREWWSRWPDANVAIACGAASGVDVLDVDGPEAEEALSRFGIAHTMCSRTARGRHLFFAHDSAMRNSAGKIAPHLDTRSSGGYVVAPPSVHPSGWVYRWEPGASPRDVAEIARWPAWAIEAMQSKPTKSVDRIARYCAKALDDEARELARTPKGTRNEAIRNAAAKLGGLVHLGGFSTGDAERELRRAIESWPASERDPRKDIDTLRRGLAWGIQNPRSPPQDRALEPPIDDVPPPADDDIPPEHHDRRPDIFIRVEELDVADEAVAALSSLGDVNLYQRGNRLVHVVRERVEDGTLIRPPNAPLIQACAPARLRELMASSAHWLKRDGRRSAEDEWVPAHPPTWAVQAVAARGEWSGIRPLEAAIEHPILRLDGTILDAPGYDARTHLLHEPIGRVDPIALAPTIEDARAAVDVLLEVVRDFPFETPAHRASWLAGVLTSFACYAIEGPCPLFLVTANTRGAGKTLLVDVAGIVATGRSLARTVWDPDEAEMRKRITTIALEGTPIVLLDNVGSTLGNASFDAALTGTAWTDRILGRNESASTLPLLTIWWATGNNTILAADTARRTLHVRLYTEQERPEERTDFTFREPLRAWASRVRPRLAAAALTILRAYCAAGRPDPKLTPWGSFEAWSAIVRNALVWTGQPDPLLTREALMESSDQDAVVLRDLLEAWHAIYGDAPRLLSAVLEDVDKPHAQSGSTYGERYQELREAITAFAGSDTPSTRSIAKRLQRMRGRVVDGRCFDQPPKSGSSKVARAWRVRSLAQSDRAAFAD